MRIKRFTLACVAVLIAWGYLSGGALSTATAGNPAGSPVPAVAITEVPPLGEGGPERTFPIGGTARGVNPVEYKVAIYAYAGGTWWVQPLADAPLTDIGEDGQWQTDTHAGTQYAALLVKRTYQPRATLSTLPKVGGDVVAVDRKPGPPEQKPVAPDEPASQLPIAIIQVPLADAGGPNRTFPIAGRVHVANPAEYKVAIYAYAGGTWWVQPLADAPLTDVGEDGRWQTDTHGGTQYAALLVKPTYQPRATLSTLPKVGGDVVAIDRKSDGQSGLRPPAGELSIAVTMVPPMLAVGSDSTLYPIEGMVTGIDPAECKVVVYAYAGDRWWVQPYANAPLTNIEEDGKWHTETHPGARYASLLVKETFEAKAVLSTLPKVGGDVLAMDLKQEVLVHFSGYDWVVKTSGNRRVGPGPNYFSEDAVFVDNEGLHLRVFDREGKYFCGEVVSKRSFGYGRYRFVVGSNVDDLDSNLVLGLFTWNDDPAYSHREIDIEISSWGKPGNDNAQYVIQPYTRKDNIFRFAIPQGLRESSYSFLWKQGSVLFQSDGVKGNAGAGDAGVVCPTRIFTQGIPQAGKENARINLWLVNGRAPGKGGKEILIREFKFDPVP